MPTSAEHVRREGDELEWRVRAIAAEGERDLLRAVLDLLPDYFYVHNWELRFQHVNKAGASLWNSTPDQVIGRTYEDVDPNAAQAKQVVEICRSQMRRGGSSRLDGFVFMSPDGREQTLTQFNIAFKNPTTGEDMLLGLARDMTAEARLVAEQAARQMMEQELRLARAIQKALEPSPPPISSKFKIGGANMPSSFASGDFFDWWQINDIAFEDSPDLVLCLGDVTGHGVGAALSAATCRAYARVLIGDRSSLSSGMRRVNQRLCKEMAGGRFVTFACVFLNTTRCGISYLSAGHGPTLLSRAGGEVAILDSAGLPLGIADDEMYETVTDLDLNPGDVLVLLSDGLIESRAPDGGMLTVTQISAEARRLADADCSADTIATGLIELARQHTSGKPPDDDLTVLVIMARR
jgi:sigma-B regulation protein RsbU (phosphoserine phosphatase)